MSDYDRDDDDRPNRRDDSDQPHRGTMILILGIGGIVLPLVIACAPIGIVLSLMAWLWGKKDLALMDNGEMDPEGRSSTQAGMICGIIGTVINALYLLMILFYVVILAGFFAVAANAPPPQAIPAPPAPAVKVAPDKKPPAPMKLPEMKEDRPIDPDKD